MNNNRHRSPDDDPFGDFLPERVGPGTRPADTMPKLAVRRTPSRPPTSILRIEPAGPPPPHDPPLPTWALAGRWDWRSLERFAMSRLGAMALIALAATAATLTLWFVTREAARWGSSLSSDRPTSSPEAMSGGVTTEGATHGDRIVGTTLEPVARPSSSPAASSARSAQTQPRTAAAATFSPISPKTAPRAPDIAPRVVPPPAAPLRRDAESAPSRLTGVQRALIEYSDAVSALNAAAVAAIWPSADVDGLGLEFEQLYQQRLRLEECRVAQAGSISVAVCTGGRRYVEKGSKKVEQLERGRWEFSLREENGSWLIDQVSRVVTR